MPDNSLEPAVQKLLAHLQSNRPRTLIALAGIPGSGKTTVATKLAAEVNARAGAGAMVALGMDGFHFPLAILREMPDPDEVIARRGSPWTFDSEGLASRLRAVRAAAGRESVGWPGFQHEIGDPVEDATTVESGVRLVLVEGLYLLLRDDGWDEVSRLFDERWFFDTPPDISMDRLANRHMAAWGISREEAERRIAVNDGLNAEIVMASRDNSDWIVVDAAEFTG